jgi:hypothetical protein
MTKEMKVKDFRDQLNRYADLLLMLAEAKAITGSRA